MCPSVRVEVDSHNPWISNHLLITLGVRATARSSQIDVISSLTDFKHRYDCYSEQKKDDQHRKSCGRKLRDRMAANADHLGKLLGDTR